MVKILFDSTKNVYDLNVDLAAFANHFEVEIGSCEAPMIMKISFPDAEINWDILGDILTTRNYKVLSKTHDFDGNYEIECKDLKASYSLTVGELMDLIELKNHNSNILRRFLGLGESTSDKKYISPPWMATGKTELAKPNPWALGPFNIYYGEERATGRHKTIVKWCNGRTTTVYKLDNKPTPVIYPVAYAFVKELFGSNTQFKKWVDKCTYKFSPTQYIVEGVTKSPNPSMGELDIRFMFPVKSKGAIDIYDQAALMLAADFYGGVKTFNNIVKEALCENGK